MFVVEIFTDRAVGYINIDTSGGNGNKAQNGADGRRGADESHKVTAFILKFYENRFTSNEKVFSL